MFRYFLVSSALLAVSTASLGASVSFRCVSSPQARPQYTFFVSVDAREAGISERNRSSIYALISRRTVPVQGCAPAQQAQVTRSSVYVECIADGDAGFLDLRTDRTGRLSGKMTFPEGSPQFDVDMDTEIPISCVRTR
ncbi:MAG TPA: hypothetical protein VM598_02635 [Bdellovibrionota bacterium]|nr:hypothetical protein [Bdellovibrionota bacterium]